jgi:hypothetical protein
MDIISTGGGGGAPFTPYLDTKLIPEKPVENPFTYRITNSKNSPVSQNPLP